ncbi:hypothetical protein A2630_03320 [Candidatus Woesebacteria bacterium RIFCSPHIGHO2_01_FULL_44_10]|uniref:Type II secretion system protein GspG C-terminal domain-containing protein n=1 Tax=Candidatus Woesebacteria bacterium RIFCSPLOWO2_01_FULL_44_14 TaxID=1802525 RepID=A0A1F8BXS3_9BACT|nr:MAG: hypothetical protein A2630_03320 [Candidatus Woesebacteria bacterium RIFCSPHIGHO2_01_FULL_44_10]OGM56441.1 MAG: hypothetical protein A3F62_01980 [Candidatus Woesebacteria bacterium RIFCSPHIGHO2_12_FULL_44_11]OGM68842.1 MAG: hypothetical protein A2975_00525 [Candidatus Woesebacteria bacterium RIFCSPLOWO2_01_FULL_44_14]
MKKGFTLIELLVVISIIGVVISLSMFGLAGARKSGRDAKRKADLEQIRSGLEIYRSDCGRYPSSLGASLVGSGLSADCLVTNTYITSTPYDPLDPDRAFLYSSTGLTYELCAALEQGNQTAVTCGGSSACGGKTCNYKVTNP